MFFKFFLQSALSKWTDLFSFVHLGRVVQLCPNWQKLNCISATKCYLWARRGREFSFEVVVKPRNWNVGLDHLYWLESGETRILFNINYTMEALYGERLLS